MTINDTLAHISEEAYVGSLCLRELQGKGVVVEGLEQQLTLVCDRALAAFFGRTPPSFATSPGKETV